MSSSWPPEDWTFVTGPIRPEAKAVHVYNEGLLVFLYDEANEERIVQSGARILTGFAGSEDFKDPALQPLFADGALVVCPLEGDSGVDLEILTGAPLREDELGSLHWRRDESAISLPSGRLCIHSYNTLPVEDDLGDQAGIVEVAPGRYRLSFYTKDWEAEVEAGRDWLEEAAEAGIPASVEERIDSVIVLTPTDLQAVGGALFPDA